MYQTQKASRKEWESPSEGSGIGQTQKGQDGGISYVPRNEGRYLKLTVIGTLCRKVVRVRECQPRVTEGICKGTYLVWDSTLWANNETGLLYSTRTSLQWAKYSGPFLDIAEQGRAELMTLGTRWRHCHRNKFFNDIRVPTLKKQNPYLNIAYRMDDDNHICCFCDSTDFCFSSHPSVSSQSPLLHMWPSVFSRDHVCPSFHHIYSTQYVYQQ